MSPGISIPSSFPTPSSAYQKGFVKTEFALKQESNFSPDLSLKLEEASPLVSSSNIGSLGSSIKLKSMSEVKKETDIKFENFKLPSSSAAAQGSKSGEGDNVQPLTTGNLK